MKFSLSTLKTSNNYCQRSYTPVTLRNNFKTQALKFRRNINILYVEDNLINQAMGQKYVESIGGHCKIASNGLEALKLLKHNSYDLILMDIDMPVLNGLEATKHIRKDLKLDLPIIAFATNTSEQDVEDYLKAGMNDHIGKPCTKAELAEILRKWNVITIMNEAIPARYTRKVYVA